MSSRFDLPAPELEHHLVVPVGKQQAVTALRFLTDRSPYVITGGGQDGALEREVPIRDGTRTRSARRDELLRLLLPAIAPPSAQLLSAKLHPRHFPQTEGQRPGRTSIHLVATVFFQQPALSTGAVMLPAHLMHARLDFDGSVGSLLCELHYGTGDAGIMTHQPMLGAGQDRPIVVTTPTILHGVDRRKDGVVVTGPGTLTVSTTTTLDGDLRSTLMALDVVQIHLSFGVAGVERRIKLDAQLDCIPQGPEERRVEWCLNVPAEDPWAEAEK